MLVDMNEVLLPARAGGYAVGFFNAVNVEMARAVIDAAEELRAPVMIGTAEVLLPTTELSLVADYLIPMAREAAVPVCVHFDHGLSFERCMEAVKRGFTSVMYDCSTSDYEENVSKTADMVRIAHALGATVEAELGHVGDNEGAGKLTDPSAYFTDPACARDFVRRTGVDSLAVAVGNAHGAYKLPPKLDFDRISAIAEATGIPLVLHGGSGIPDEGFRRAVSLGICKVNIFTDLDSAGKRGIEKGLCAGAGSLSALIPYGIAEMKAAAKEKMLLFGSAGRALVE